MKPIGFTMNVSFSMKTLLLDCGDLVLPLLLLTIFVVLPLISYMVHKITKHGNSSQKEERGSILVDEKIYNEPKRKTQNDSPNNPKHKPPKRVVIPGIPISILDSDYYLFPYIKYAIEEIKCINKNYIVPERIYTKLQGNRFNTAILKELIHHISYFLGIPNMVNLTDVKIVDRAHIDDEQEGAAGRYINQDRFYGNIEMEISSYSTLDQIIAIACHECTHAYLYAKNISYGETTKSNETFTDIAAVYLGFGECLEKGYKTVTHGGYYNKIGYLDHCEVKEVINEFNHYKAAYEEERKAKAETVGNEKLRREKKLNELLVLADKLSVNKKRNQEMLERMKSQAITIPASAMYAIQENYYYIETGEIQARVDNLLFSVKKAREGAAVEMEHLKKELIEFCSRIEGWNAIYDSFCAS